MKKGFTLVEMVIAAALLAMSLSLFIGSFVSSKRSAVIANYRMNALNIARENMERLMAKNYFDSDLAVGSHPVYSTNNYQISHVVTANPVYSDAKDIALTVSWINPTASITSSITVCSSVSRALHQ